MGLDFTVSDIIGPKILLRRVIHSPKHLRNVQKMDFTRVLGFSNKKQMTPSFIYGSDSGLVAHQVDEATMRRKNNGKNEISNDIESIKTTSH
ncbi:unnamed protein product [Sphenostylis stenocarpa]|uniref:Uncharacterized protein n=1 Tax=Sphenostylis stenocarpa TaxID=92480 RepID=A0AA86SYT9_9FABA|nr:unnamed protein product [Sphenostylis stenocarpa]